MRRGPFNNPFPHLEVILVHHVRALQHRVPLGTDVADSRSAEPEEWPLPLRPGEVLPRLPGRSREAEAEAAHHFRSEDESRVHPHRLAAPRIALGPDRIGRGPCTFNIATYSRVILRYSEETSSFASSG